MRRRLPQSRPRLWRSSILCTPGLSASSSSACQWAVGEEMRSDRKSTRLNSSHSQISYAVFCLKKKKKKNNKNVIKKKQKTNMKNSCIKNIKIHIVTHHMRRTIHQIHYTDEYNE